MSKHSHTKHTKEHHNHSEDSHKEAKKHHEEDAIEFNPKQIIQKTGAFLKSDTTKKIVVPAILIFIAVFFAFFFRMYPFHIPAADDWAERSIMSNVEQQIAQQVRQQNPNLPEANQQRLIQQQLNQFMRENQAMIDEQKEELAEYFRSHIQDDTGQTYLLAIDPYLWLGYAENYLECGHAGCYEMIDEDGNTVYSTLRNGREVHVRGFSGEAYFGVMIYRFFNIFGDYSLLTSFFFISIFFVAGAVIPAFFLAQKLGGNVGGFVAGMIVAVNGALLGRTPGGFADNDGAIILFPLLLMWCIVGYGEAQSLRNRILFGLGGALSLVTMSFIWPTQHVVLAMSGGAGLYIGILALITFIKNYGKADSIIFNIKDSILSVKNHIILLGVYIAGLFAAMTVFVNPRYVITFLNPILDFVFSQEVAVRTVWPNVLVTVAELRVDPYSVLVAQLGGSLLVLIALIGLILLFIGKDEQKKRHLLLASVILIWGIATVFSFSRGIRFAILVIPSFAVCAGVAVGMAYRYASAWFVREMNADVILTKSILSIFVVLLFIIPIVPAGSSNASMLGHAHNIATGQIPSYNDAWDDTLSRIKNDAEDGYGYVTTWWDFGHWIVQNGIRVTFDGGDQGRRIHWVGKTLITDDEDKAVGLLRMLNCYQERAGNRLEEYLENDTLSAVNLVYETVSTDREGARAILEARGISPEFIEEYLEYTHCSEDILYPHYFITSEDMVGKAGVWGHFGSWNFTRATMYQTVRGQNLSQGTQILMENFSLDQQTAQQYYYEIQEARADQWVAGWPGYYSNRAGCQTAGGTTQCGNGIVVDRTDMTGFLATQQGNVPLASVSYINDDGEFVVIPGESDAQFSALLLPDGSSIIADPLHAGSMFTRLFFYGGHGLRHFEQFYDTTQILGGGRILTWRVHWDPFEEPLEFEDDIPQIIIGEDDFVQEIEIDGMQSIEQ
ncbi:MAG: STT3 domain-containing protein [Candidatus Woesearchaeota archaeon]